MRFLRNGAIDALEHKGIDYNIKAAFAIFPRAACHIYAHQPEQSLSRTR